MKTGGAATDVEISDRLREILGARRASTLRRALERGRVNDSPYNELVFESRTGSPLDAVSFRRSVWNPLVIAAWEGKRHITPHALRHTWTTLHLVNGTPLKWIQDQAGVGLVEDVARSPWALPAAADARIRECTDSWTRAHTVPAHGSRARCACGG